MQDDISFMKQDQKTIMRKGWDTGRPNPSDETLKVPFAITEKEMSTESRVLADVISAAIHLRWEGEVGVQELNLSDSEAASKC